MEYSYKDSLYMWFTVLLILNYISAKNKHDTIILKKNH